MVDFDLPEAVRALDAEIDASVTPSPLSTPTSNGPAIMVDPRTKIAGEILTPGIKPYIEKLFDKSTNSAERGQALQLLTSIALGEQLQRPEKAGKLPQRPKTAMAMLGSAENGFQPRSGIHFNPYETSYKSHFPTRPMTAARAERPTTAVNSFVPRHALGGKVGTTTYSDEFHTKLTNKSEPIRAGTSSGFRNNNPHPKKEFMVWRYPRSSASLTSSSDAQKENMDLEMQMAVTGEEFDRVIRGKCRSVYQSDFAGLPQGADVSAQFADLSADPMARLKYSKESTSRSIHGPPAPLPAELRVPTTRFGSRRDRMPAFGTLPGVVSTTQMHVQSRTTYDRDVNDRANAMYGHFNDIRRMGRHHTEDAVKKCMSMTAGKDRHGERGYAEDVGRDANSVCGLRPECTPPFDNSSRRSHGGSSRHSELGVAVGRPHVTFADCIDDRH